MYNVKKMTANGRDWLVEKVGTAKNETRGLKMAYEEAVRLSEVNGEEQMTWVYDHPLTDEEFLYKEEGDGSTTYVAIFIEEVKPRLAKDPWEEQKRFILGELEKFYEETSNE